MNIHAFAVQPTPLKRKAAATPKSASWTLYDPQALALDLDLSVDVVDAALERNGFNKAVRIREEVIRWKERLRHEERSLQAELRLVLQRKRELSGRLKELGEQLESVRNVLRIPREANAFDRAITARESAS